MKTKLFTAAAVIGTAFLITACSTAPATMGRFELKVPESYSCHALQPDFNYPCEGSGSI